MEKSINLTGLSTNPSDYTCEDGNLSAAINVEHNIGAITSVDATSPKLVSNMGSNFVVFRHDNDSYKNVIVKLSTNKYCWIVENEDGTLGNYVSANTFGQLDNIDVKSVVSVKNILIFYSDDDVYYYLYRNNSYSYLGNKLPNVEMSFGLEAHTYHNHANGNATGGLVDIYRSPKYTSSETPYTKLDFRYISTDKLSQENAINASLAEANMFVSNTSSLGYFSQPFLVRFALRFFDGSHAMESSPVLITPCVRNNPIIIAPKVNRTGTAHLAAFGIAGKLKYFLRNADLSSWKDIVSSVDIFVTKPIYTYKQTNAKYRGLYLPFLTSDYTPSFPQKEFISNSVLNASNAFRYYQHTIDVAEDVFAREGNDCIVSRGYVTGSLRSSEGYDFKDTSNNIVMSEWTDNYYMSEDVLSMISCLYLDYKDEDEILKEIEDSSTFYLIKSIGIEELVSNDNGCDINIEEGILEHLETGEVLESSYDSHHKILPSVQKTYNGRLNEAKFKKIYFDGFKLDDMVQMQNKIPGSKFLSVVTITNTNGKIVRASMGDNDYNINIKYFMLFYPDSDAESIDLYYESAGGVKKISCELKNHNFIDGKYCLVSSATSTSTSYTSLQDVIDDIVTENGSTMVSNEIRTSEVYNPFVYKAANVESIGTGKIISLVPQAVALSQGQFGEFPMLCFTTDGIWALSTNETGGWAAKQPISRDVVLDEKKSNILQLDKDIIFATTRGLMSISGSNIQCISEVFDGKKDSYSVSIGGTLVNGDNVAYNKILTLTDILDKRLDASVAGLFPDFKEFIKNAVFLYDYSNQRIIIGNPSKPFAYVYNMRDKYWTSICQCIKSSVNSYPLCYAMTEIKNADNTKSNLLVDFSTIGTNPGDIKLPSNGVIVTRPLKLDAPDSLKTITKIIARGKMKNNSVHLVLYGSRDMNNWVVVGSCYNNKLLLHNGTPYKYFRVAIISKLDNGESLNSLDIEYDIKMDDKMR